VTCSVNVQVEGNLIKWQKWQVRISFNWREGLVLHNVGYEDEGCLRPILYRAAIAEMAVPYAERQVPIRSCSWRPMLICC
jgi:primary-amine oxidase